MLWGIEARARAAKWARSAGPLRVIEKVFALMAKRVQENPRLASEILARQATRIGPPPTGRHYRRQLRIV